MIWNVQTVEWNLTRQSQAHEPVTGMRKMMENKILTETEFFNLKVELTEIKMLIGIEKPEKLAARKQKILNRLDESKQARLERACLSIVS